MKKTKPRIRIAQRQDGLWAVTGHGLRLHGWTVERAYRNWWNSYRIHQKLQRRATG